MSVRTAGMRYIRGHHVVSLYLLDLKPSLSGWRWAGQPSPTLRRNKRQALLIVVGVKLLLQEELNQQAVTKLSHRSRPSSAVFLQKSHGWLRVSSATRSISSKWW